jgi:hypothetical protein
MPEGRRLPVTLAWEKVFNEMSGRRLNQRWAKVCGPLAAAIVALMELDWKPLLPSTWHDNDEVEWTLCKESSSSDLKFSLSAAAERKHWARATRCHNGEGLLHGIDLTARSVEHTRLIKAKSLDEAGVQATIVRHTWLMTCTRFGRAPLSGPTKRSTSRTRGPEPGVEIILASGYGGSYRRNSPRSI